MEAIGAIILVFVGIFIFRLVLSAGARTAGAAAKAVIGRGSFSDNMELAFHGMGPMEARLTDAKFGEHDDGPSFKAIEVKGLFPVNTNRHVGFVTSVFDKTGGDWEPVLSALEAFQEPGSVVYQHSSNVGQVSPDQGFVRWARVGAIVPALLEPPYGGRRNFVAILRLVDLDDMPSITLGRHVPGESGLLWTSVLEFEHTVTEKGYREAAEHRDQARALSIQIGMAVAMADGSLDEAEGAILKAWVIKVISPFVDEKRAHLKNLYNEAMSDAYDRAQRGDLNLSALTEKLNEIAEKSTRYETIELCFDVMAADGVANSDEMRIIRTVAEALELDYDEIDKMRDQRIVGLSTNVSNQASIEDLLGIEASWDVERTKRHLRAEFQKWNNRLNTLAEGSERDNAQRMLEAIAEARKKYG
jgi:tellurite resistance protein